ncbi:MAG: VOC family protein, partial [Gammaproteobacteria bacterium]
PLAAEPFTQGRYETDPEWHCVEAAPLHPLRVTHAVIESADVARLVDFYTTIGGLSIVASDAGVVYLGGSLEGYAHNLVIVPAATAGYGYASFEIADDAALDAAISALDARAVEITQTVDLPWKRSIFLRDPDGLVSEWTVRRAAPRDLAARGDVELLYAA